MAQNPTAVWWIRWTKIGLAEEVLPLYSYDRQTEELTATQFAGPTRAEIIQDELLWTFEIEGETVMTIDAEGVVTVPSITFKGSPSADSPRMEFMRTINSVPARVAYLTKDGVLRVDHLMELDDLPDTTDKLALFTAAIAEGGIFAAEFVEADL
jgi:hypothetical protein